MRTGRAAQGTHPHKEWVYNDTPNGYTETTCEMAR